jgi:hypothetical protein
MASTLSSVVGKRLFIETFTAGSHTWTIPDNIAGQSVAAPAAVVPFTTRRHTAALAAAVAHVW